jgi:hypothetical protein
MNNTNSSSSVRPQDALFLQPRVDQYGGHMVMTNVSRPKHSRLVYLDSRLQDVMPPVDSSATATITLPNRVNNVSAIRALSAEIPMTMKNFSAAIGNTTLIMKSIKRHNHDVNDVYLNSTTDIPDKIVTIADGQYSTVAELAAAIELAFDTVFGANIINVSVVNGRISIYLTKYLEASFFFVSDTAPTYLVNRQFGWFAGFRNLSKYAIDRNTSFTAEKEPDLNGIRYAYLVVDEFSKSAAQSSAVVPSRIQRNILAKITFDRTKYPYGSILPANLANGLLCCNQRNYNGTTDIQRLRILLMDEFGTVLEFNEIDYFSVALEVDYE